MSNLMIETVENGFLVRDGSGTREMVTKMWVFETPERLADFVETWSKGQVKAEALPTSGKAT